MFNIVTNKDDKDDGLDDEDERQTQDSPGLSESWLPIVMFITI